MDILLVASAFSSLSQRVFAELSDRVRDLESALADELLNRPGGRVFAAGSQGQVEPLRHGTRPKRPTQIVVWQPRDRA